MITNEKHRGNGTADSISGRSAALYFSQDPSIAQLLHRHGIRVRDFIMVSFLVDQGPLTIDHLARIMSIGPHDLRQCVERLTAAGLVVQESTPGAPDEDPAVRLTRRGRDVATRIDRQL